MTRAETAWPKHEVAAATFLLYVQLRLWVSPAQRNFLLSYSRNCNCNRWLIFRHGFVASGCSVADFLLCKLITVLLVISLIALKQDPNMQAMLQQALRSSLTTADTTSAADSPVEAKPEASLETCSPSQLDNEHMQQEACSSSKGAVRAQEPAQVAANSPWTDFTEQQVSTGSLSCLHIRALCT